MIIIITIQTIYHHFIHIISYNLIGRLSFSRLILCYKLSDVDPVVYDDDDVDMRDNTLGINNMNDDNVFHFHLPKHWGKQKMSDIAFFTKSVPN